MNNRFYWLIIMVMLFAGWSCGDDESAQEKSKNSVNAALSDYNQTADSFTKTLCTCFADANYAGDMHQCMLENNGQVILSGCQMDVATCYADDFTVYLRCVTNAVSTYNACVASCSTDQAYMQGCNAQHQTKLNNCNKNLPTDIRINMDACEAGQLFSCGT